MHNDICTDDANSFFLKSCSVEEHGEEALGDSEKDKNEESRIVADDSGGDGALELNDTKCNGNTSQQQNSKLPLLGHGPHGKQVVEYLLREHGEDGARDFCQRWIHNFGGLHRNTYRQLPSLPWGGGGGLMFGCFMTDNFGVKTKANLCGPCSLQGLGLIVLLPVAEETLESSTFIIPQRDTQPSNSSQPCGLICCCYICVLFAINH
ncbi:Uncharacterized protein Rs2_31220 [Raphanus sativus]|nr:Uncharacterized protein Rs2_31220 [Raphanus sativus]